MSRLKLIPWALGVCLLVASLVGANHLLNPDTPAGVGNGAGVGPETHKKTKISSNGDSLVQPGTVDSETPRASYYAPSHLQAATLVEVLVKEGQVVKPNDLLLRFDAEFQKLEVQGAEYSYQAAVSRYNEAQAAVKAQEALIEAAKVAVKGAEETHNAAIQLRDAIEKKYDSTNVTLRQNNSKTINPREEPEFVQADGAVIRLAQEVEGKKKAVLAAEAQREQYQKQVETAAYVANGAKAKLASAMRAVSQCELRADIGGTVERVEAVRGMIVGPHTRSPLLYIIPEGTRLVRVKVVPDFAYKLQDKLGRNVKILDESNLNLTYDGVVERIGTAFLPDRNAGPDLFNKATPVLEVTVRISEQIPPGQPPLLVGQPVRVNFQ